MVIIVTTAPPDLPPPPVGVLRHDGGVGLHDGDEDCVTRGPRVLNAYATTWWYQNYASFCPDYLFQVEHLYKL